MVRPCTRCIMRTRARGWRRRPDTWERGWTYTVKHPHFKNRIPVLGITPKLDRATNTLTTTKAISITTTITTTTTTGTAGNHLEMQECNTSSNSR